MEKEAFNEFVEQTTELALEVSGRSVINTQVYFRKDNKLILAEIPRELMSCKEGKMMLAAGLREIIKERKYDTIGWSCEIRI